MKISIFKSILALFMAMLLSTATTLANNKNADKAPDFNFPKTVLIRSQCLSSISIKSRQLSRCSQIFDSKHTVIGHDIARFHSINCQPHR